MKRYLIALAILVSLSFFTGCGLQGGEAGGTPEEDSLEPVSPSQNEAGGTQVAWYQRQMQEIFGARTVTVYDADKAALTVTVVSGYSDPAAFLQSCVQACDAVLTREEADDVLETVTVLFGAHMLQAGKSRTVPATIWYTKAFSREDAQHDALERAYYANAILAGQDIGV